MGRGMGLPTGVPQLTLSCPEDRNAASVSTRLFAVAPRRALGLAFNFSSVSGCRNIVTGNAVMSAACPQLRNLFLSSSL